jgi:hypothetical protein
VADAEEEVLNQAEEVLEDRVRARVRDKANKVADAEAARAARAAEAVCADRVRARAKDNNKHLLSI